jgi:hypothetical protein
MIFGDGNTIYGDKNTVYGKNNIVFGDANVIYGDDATVYGEYNRICGAGFVQHGNNNFIINKKDETMEAGKRQKTSMVQINHGGLNLQSSTEAATVQISADGVNIKTQSSSGVQINTSGKNTQKDEPMFTQTNFGGKNFQTDGAVFTQVNLGGGMNIQSPNIVKTVISTDGHMGQNQSTFSQYNFCQKNGTNVPETHTNIKINYMGLEDYGSVSSNFGKCIKCKTRDVVVIYTKCGHYLVCKTCYEEKLAKGADAYNCEECNQPVKKVFFL